MTELIETFYTAFQRLDSQAMISCYHDDVIFEDPAFGKLKGDRTKAMWQMLCESQQGQDFKIEFSGISYTDSIGQAHWQAFYTFSKTQRRVHNKIDAQFRFKDGLIIEHLDNFNLHKWATQALGLKGFILGGTGFFKRQLQNQTQSMLQKFIENKKRSG